MSTRKTIQKTISFLVWTALLVVAVTLPKFFQYELWSVFAGIAPSLLRLAYEHFDNFNLAVNRFLLWVVNKEVAWEMKAALGGDFSNQDLDHMVELILAREKSAKLLHISSFEKTITVSDIGATIKLSINSVRADEDEYQTEIVLSIARVFTPFRHSTVILRSLTRLLGSIRQQFNVEKESYSFAAIFTDENPYLGLFLRTMRLPESANLNVDYNESVGVTEGKVSVKKHKLVVVTHNLDSLQALSSKYITLSSLNLSSA